VVWVGGWGWLWVVGGLGVFSTTAGEPTTDYTYDGDGNRRTQGADATYLWDVNLALPQLAVERDGTNELTRRSYLYGLDRVALRNGAAGDGDLGTYYYHHDGLGSVVNVTDSDGAPQWSYRYDAFGLERRATQEDASAPTNPMRYTGELYDTELGLYDLRAREYNPAVGRFLQTDPVVAQLDDPYVADYVYVNNLPTSLSDPSGMFGMPGFAKSAASAFTSAVVHNPIVQWSIRHPDIIVSGAAVTCVIATGGACTPLALGAVATAVSTSAYKNGIITGEDANYGRFGVDLAITSMTFGSGSLWGALMRNEYYVASSIDREILVRVGTFEFFGTGLLIAGLRGDLDSTIGRNGK
jgi:RHS repeat-associated protein